MIRTLGSYQKKGKFPLKKFSYRALLDPFLFVFGSEEDKLKNMPFFIRAWAWSILNFILVLGKFWKWPYFKLYASYVPLEMLNHFQ